MTKRNKITIVLSTLLCGLILTSGLAVMTKGFQDFNPDHFFTNIEDSDEELLVEELHNIRFRTVKESQLPDGSIQKQVSFTIQPSNADYNDLNPAIAWNKTYSTDFESENWYEGKNISDYVTYDFNGANKQVTFTCSQPFGTEIIFSLSSKADPTIKADLKINYTRKVIQEASASLAVDGFTPNESMKITTAEPVYSIGSKGERAPNYNFDYNIEYVSASGYSYDDLFKGIQTTGIYSQNYKYQGEDYVDSAKLLQDMKDSVNEYLVSLPSLTESNVFKTDTFRDLLTYQYASHYTYKVEYSESTANFTSFVSNYKEAITNNAGYKLTVNFGEEEVYGKLLNLNVSLNNITNINFNEGEIDF